MAPGGVWGGGERERYYVGDRIEMLGVEDTTNRQGPKTSDKGRTTANRFPEIGDGKIDLGEVG